MYLAQNEANDYDIRKLNFKVHCIRYFTIRCMKNIKAQLSLTLFIFQAEPFQTDATNDK